MKAFMCSLTILVAVCCMLSGSATAQSTASSLGQPMNCSMAQSMPNVNITQFDGTWYEVLRQPAMPAGQCVEIDVANSTNTLTINVTMATNPNLLNLNITMSANITMDSANTAGYNVTYSVGQVNRTTTWLKLLNTDYSNYAYICGFTNASDPTTVFGAILTRERVPTSAALATYQQQAAAEYSDFSTNMSLITQSAKCYTNNASSTLPALATMFTLLFAILKYFK